ncbi:diguanylate cyclase [Gluconacetobacter aggeris]|uniref:diguanylate cyclase n=1 Tax=Gluconacetobacter aggeris TaxID=1286186 RepID=A0A7W4NYP2_9PROT|nr:diguanylate cyclase [Gluconacetobacter aggeris]
MLNGIPRLFLPAAGVGTIVLGAALLGIFSRPFQSFAESWPANAILLGLLIVYPSLSRASVWVAAFTAFLLAGYVTGDDTLTNVWLTAANMAGVGTGYVLYQCVDAEQRRMDHPLAILYLLAICGGAAMAAALVGSGLSTLFFGRSIWIRFWVWFTSELNRYVILLPVCFALQDWAKDRRAAAWWRWPSARTWRKLPPLASLGVSVILSILVGGPGAIAFPVPALLWCALTYSILPMSLMILLLNQTMIGLMMSGLIVIPSAYNYIDSTMSFRLGLTLLVLGPLTVTTIMARQRSLIAQLNHALSRDSLTNTLARRAYLDQTEILLRRSMPGPFAGVALLMLDLDRFKQINDRCGHFAGDMALVAAAKAITGTLRETDLIGRLGGEEFAITLFDITPHEAGLLAERLRLAVEESEIVTDEGTILRATISIGLVHGYDLKGQALRRLLAAADAALYMAKAQGRNRVVRFDATMEGAGDGAEATARPGRL